MEDDTNRQNESQDTQEDWPVPTTRAGIVAEAASLKGTRDSLDELDDKQLLEMGGYCAGLAQVGSVGRHGSVVFSSLTTRDFDLIYTLAVTVLADILKIAKARWLHQQASKA